MVVSSNELNRENNQTIMMVTHDIFAAGFADRIILFKDGIVDQVISRKDDDYAKYLANFMAGISLTLLASLLSSSTAL